MTTREFNPEQGTVRHEVKASVVILSSNSWWEIEARYTNTDNGILTIQNCKQIPGGVRQYTRFGQDSLEEISARAGSMAFPPPGLAEIFVPWLAFCPSPQLPLLDNGRMRRFISVPTCQSELFNQPQNQGTYQIHYLEPGGCFISDLFITNNGISVDVAVSSNGLVPDVHILHPPFDRGYLNHVYQVLETTNLNGRVMPQHVIYKSLAPNWDGGRADDLRVVFSCELRLTRVSFAETNGLVRLPTPPLLYVLDDRPAGPSLNRPANYMITNDVWMP